MDVSKYTYRITWSEPDSEFVGLCAEFPSLSWMDKDQGAALQGITRLIAEVVRDLKRRRELVPQPLSTKHYSGEFRVRIPPEQHRLLAMAAAEQGVSLNRLVSLKLSI